MEFESKYSDLFNLLFMTSDLPSVLKTPKIFPNLKKDLKLGCSIYRPISLLSNIEKNNWKTYLKKIVYLSQ